MRLLCSWRVSADGNGGQSWPGCSPIQSEHQRALKSRQHCCMEALLAPHHFWTLPIAISCVIKSPEKTGEKNNLGKVSVATAEKLQSFKDLGCWNKHHEPL